MDSDAAWLRRAVELGVSSVEAGGGPFGAVIVIGERVFEGTNRVAPSLDPSAHAEIEAIRAACLGVGDFRLVGGTLYASCEPCPMCLAAALWARLSRVVYAAGREDAAKAGFDDARFYDALSVRLDSSALELVRREIPEGLAPFEAWRAHPGRIEY